MICPHCGHEHELETVTSTGTECDTLRFYVCDGVRYLASALPDKRKPSIPCRIAGCRKAARREGLCELHYEASRMRGSYGGPVKPRGPNALTQAYPPKKYAVVASPEAQARQAANLAEIRAAFERKRGEGET